MEDLFESVVHMKLLVAMKMNQARIIRGEIDLDFAEWLNEDHILQKTPAVGLPYTFVSSKVLR